MFNLWKRIFEKPRAIFTGRPVDMRKMVDWVKTGNGCNELINFLENQRDVIISYLANDVSFKQELDIFKKGEIMAFNQILAKLKEMKTYKENKNGNADSE